MSLPKLQTVLCCAVMTAVAVGSGAIVLGQNGGFVGADEPATGRIVPIAPGGDAQVVLGDSASDEAQLNSPQVELPKHWIGILLGPIPDEVRAQVDVPEDQGVWVRQVVPESPAAKAGIKVFDIVLTANEQSITSGRDLMALVQQEGTSGGKITLDVLRRGAHQSITITPEARPEPTADDTTNTIPGQGWGLGGAMRGMPGMPGFGPGGPSPQFRGFGPGGALSQGFSLNQLPNGVSVSIQKQNDEPAHITVQRGNDTWEIVGDDPSSLAQLPDDVRPFVEQLLSDSSSASTFQPPSMSAAPGLMGPGMMGSRMRGFDDDAMQQQLQRMEQQLKQMQMMLEHDFAPQGQTPVPIQPDHSDDAADSEAN